MKNIYTLLIVYLFCGILGIKANDLKWKITGKVIENQTEQEVSYATVVLMQKSDQRIITGTITNEAGEFELNKIALGSYVLKISFMGYQEKIIEDFILNDSQATINLGLIRLKPNLEALEAVEISAKIAPVSNSIDKQVIQVDKNLSAQGGSAVDAIKLSPSAQTTADGGISLRGSTNFKVLINGKPTTMDPNSVLKQTPANQISKIEVITNPSVKYSSEGGAGIINIILKKGYSSGFNGILNFGVGSKNKYNGDASFNLNKEKTSYSFGFEWKDETTTAFNNYFRDMFNETNVHKATMMQNRRMKQTNLSFRLGLDHTTKRNNSISYSLHTGKDGSEADIRVETSGFTIPATVEEHRYNTFLIKMEPTYFTNNLGHVWNINEKGSKLESNVYYSYIDYYLFNNQDFTLTNRSGEIIDDEPYKQEVINDNNSHDLRIETDYTAVLSETSKLETGLSFQRYNRFLDITYAQFNYEIGDWLNNPLYTNKYNFDEDILGVYANMNTSILGIKSSFGLRMEYTDRLLKRKQSSESYSYDKVNFFPGFSFTKSIGETSNLNLAMSNRINRPDEYMMNPFPEFEDDYFYSEGNPYLIPELIRNLEFGYKTSQNGTVFSTNLYYRKTQDKIDQKLTIGDDDKIHIIFHNESKDRTFGLESMINISPVNWWSVNANANFYHYKVSADIDGTIEANKAYSWSSQLVNSIKLAKNTNLQVIGYYQNRTMRSQGELTGFYFVDLALKHTFLDGRLAVNLQLKDVLQSRNYELKTSTGKMKLIGDFNNESPIFKFNISYDIFNFKKKTKDVQTEFDM